jgi:hypothetical protein
VLVSFALGTAAGDWTLDLTGWSPGRSVLLPAGLITLVLLAWKFGAGPVLSFWLACILTRPLGANIGDYLSSSSDDGDLGLSTLGTSIMFLGTILAVVTYLTKTHKDKTELLHYDTGRGTGECRAGPTGAGPAQRVDQDALPALDLADPDSLLGGARFEVRLPWLQGAERRKRSSTAATARRLRARVRWRGSSTTNAVVSAKVVFCQPATLPW